MDFLNVIVSRPEVQPEDRDRLFPPDEEVRYYNPALVDMYDLLVLLGAFSSRTQARKNWKKTGQEIPEGWNEWFVGKKRRHLCTWNPSE